MSSRTFPDASFLFSHRRSTLDLGLGKAGFATCSLVPHKCSLEKALLPVITALAIQTASTSAAGGGISE